MRWAWARGSLPHVATPPVIGKALGHGFPKGGGSGMTVGFVAAHYPQPMHFDEFVARVHQVAGVLRSTPGCLSAECWVTADGDAVVSTARGNPTRLSQRRSLPSATRTWTSCSTSANAAPVRSSNSAPASAGGGCAAPPQPLVQQRQRRDLWVPECVLNARRGRCRTGP